MFLNLYHCKPCGHFWEEIQECQTDVCEKCGQIVKSYDATEQAVLKEIQRDARLLNQPKRALDNGD